MAAAADPPDMEALLSRMAAMEAKIETLSDELSESRAENERKDEIIKALTKRLYGSSSERMDPAQQELGFDELLLGKPETPLETGDQEEAHEEKSATRKCRRRKRDLFPRNLMIIVDGVIIPDEVSADPDKWKKIGEEAHDELGVTRSQMFWRRTIREKFIRIGDRSQPPVIAPAPEPSIPGTLCAPELAAKIIIDKFCDHLPYDRQSKRIQREHGVMLSTSTLTGWAHATANLLRPVGDAIKAEILRAGAIQVDETPIDYLSPGHGKTRKGYLWVSLDPQGNTVYYDWRTGRSQHDLLEVLGYDPQTGKTKFQGTIQCDGYSAYLAVAIRYPGIKLAACLAHIRRNFYDAKEQVPRAVKPILTKIQELYQIEKKLRQKEAPPDDRKRERQDKSRPTVDEIKQQIDREKTKHLPKSKLGEAISYALNQWEQFEEYLEDGRLEIDNNLVENAVRPTKLGSKNWLFFGSAAAGDNNALLYTLVENCKRQGLDPEDYLSEVIRKLPADVTPEQAAELTPAKVAAARAEATAEDVEAEIQNTAAA